MAAEKTRDRIVAAADQLIYQRGYEPTSFADVSAVVGISRGNFYHHFKTKDAILDAVIQDRQAKTSTMLRDWEEAGGTPKERIRCFIRILIANRAKIRLYGCPVGSLTTELSKLDHASRPEAVAIFTQFRAWLTGQFRALGQPAEEADDLALQCLARSQGVSAMMTAFPDEDFVDREVARMEAWLDRIAEPDRLS